MSYAEEWAPGPVLLGGLLLILVAPPFAMIAIVVLAVVVAAALVTLAGAVIAAPYLLARYLRPRLAERRLSTEGPGPVARVIARVGTVTQKSGVAALEDPS
jgi:membrane protein implicated in regulation of membrane protease activity